MSRPWTTPSFQSKAYQNLPKAGRRVTHLYHASSRTMAPCGGHLCTDSSLNLTLLSWSQGGGCLMAVGVNRSCSPDRLTHTGNGHCQVSGPFPLEAGTFLHHMPPRQCQGHIPVAILRGIVIGHACQFGWPHVGAEASNLAGSLHLPCSMALSACGGTRAFLARMRQWYWYGIVVE